MIVELEKWRLIKIFFKNFLLAQKMRLEISGRPLGVKFRIQGHLGVEKGEKHPLGQNCPKADATITQMKADATIKNVPIFIS